MGCLFDNYIDFLVKIVRVFEKEMQNKSSRWIKPRKITMNYFFAHEWFFYVTRVFWFDEKVNKIWLGKMQNKRAYNLKKGIPVSQKNGLHLLKSS